MRWKSICWRRILNRNATRRRGHLAKSIRRESQRKARGDAELEAILQAQKQKEEVQAEQQLRSQAGRVTDPVSEMRDSQRNPSLAGLKRKILHGEELNPVTNSKNPRKVARGDTARRSKVMERVSAPLRGSLSSKPGTSPSPPHLSTASLPGRSLLLDRNNRTILRRSTGGHKTDSTHTDYFRLKALGVDPDTPVFPDTKSSLERRRRCQEELSHPTPRKRASTLSSARVRTSGRDDATSAINIQAPINTTTPKTSLPVSKQISLEATSRLIDSDDDDFLRQIREVRAAMSEDTEWFRTQAAQIEKEVEQEELRRSASQKSSTHSDGAAASGLHRGLSRVNGYDYAPSIPQSDSRLLLSRTEQRIRATGAHGLATKPVSDYLPVAMSKSTRAALINGEVPGRAKKRKGKIKHNEKDSKYIYESDNNVEEDGLATERYVLARKRVRQNHQKRLARASSNAFEASKGSIIIDAENGDGAAAIANADADQHKALRFDEDPYDEEDEENGFEEEEPIEKEEFVIGVVEEEEGYAQPRNNGIDEGDEGEDEAEDDEDDDGSVVDENLSEAGGSTTSSSLNGGQGEQPGRKANPFHMRLRSATPESHTNPDQVFTPGGTQMSRATSGTGVSADDALVLSD